MSTTSAAESPTDLVLTPLLREEVEKKVAAGLIAAVRDKMFFIHRKRGFATGCDCSYCELKRLATFEIGTLRFMPISHHRGDHWAERRMRARKYRKALALLER